VAALLRAHEEAGSFLGRPACPAVTTDVPSGPLAEADAGRQGAVPEAPRPDEGHGSRIGPYKLLRQIGEGGLGTVFVADQQEPSKRRVALEVIKPGMDLKQVIARSPGRTVR
jgi:serine/threonine-protein kinase